MLSIQWHSLHPEKISQRTMPTRIFFRVQKPYFFLRFFHRTHPPISAVQGYKSIHILLQCASGRMQALRYHFVQPFHSFRFAAFISLCITSLPLRLLAPASAPHCKSGFSVSQGKPTHNAQSSVRLWLCFNGIGVVNLPMPPCTSRTRFLLQVFALAFRLTTFAPAIGGKPAHN